METEDAGVYTCVARNSEGEATCDIPLVVNGEYIILWSSSVSVEFLSEITLSSNNHIYIYYCVLCYIHYFSTFSFIYFILEILCSVVFCLTVSFGFILYLELWLIISFLVLF